MSATTPKVMGIINITEDSYFKESRVGNEKEFEIRLEKLIAEGVDIVDIGACSTRPGSVSVSEEVEWNGIRLALERLKHYPEIALSIDTFRASIVQKAYNYFGEFIVNDISAGEDDTEMLKTVGELKLRYIAMHKRGNPLTMQSLCNYDNPVKDIIDYFKEFEKRATQHGITDYILDPGFGFAKNIEQNFILLKELSNFKSLNREILIGISRKGFIYKTLNITPEEALPATTALHLQALINGASILRVHDVKAAKEVISLFLHLQ